MCPRQPPLRLEQHPNEDAIIENVKKSSLLFLILIAVVIGGCATDSGVRTVSGRTAAERLLATSFAIRETDDSTSPVSSGNFELTMSGRRSGEAIEATEHFVPSGSPRLIFTVYASKTVYCHLGSDLASGGFCDLGDGYDNYISFESISFLRSIASGKSVVTSKGRTASFSGSDVSTSSTYGTVHEHWTGTLAIGNGLITKMQYSQSDSLGGVGHGSAAFSADGRVAAIAPPSGVEAHL
jgi:hypothetical protein